MVTEGWWHRLAEVCPQVGVPACSVGIPTAAPTAVGDTELAEHLKVTGISSSICFIGIQKVSSQSRSHGMERNFFLRMSAYSKKIKTERKEERKGERKRPRTGRGCCAQSHPPLVCCRARVWSSIPSKRIAFGCHLRTQPLLLPLLCFHSAFPQPSAAPARCVSHHGGAINRGLIWGEGLGGVVSSPTHRC